MKLRVIARFLSVMVLLISACMIFPLAWALKDGTDDVGAFLISMLLGTLFSAALFAAGRTADPKDMGTREAFASVTLAWVFASLIGCLPYIIGGYVPSLTDAYFEAMSGFTTTGATILTNVEINPRGILMWRSQTQWLGGMGIVVLTIALLPMLGMSVTQLFKAEVPGLVLEKITPRIQDVAIMLWAVYMGLTFAGTALLMVGGMSLFDSLCHVFAAVSTGGFSSRNASLAAYNSAYFDWVLTAVMFLAGANFNLHLFAIKNKTLKPYMDPEFRFYSGIIVFSTAAVAIYIYTQGFFTTIADGIRFAAFQVVSIITTTGFVSADFALWPAFTQMLLLTLMLVGGCAGSTAGAVKCVRVLIGIKQIGAELKRFIHPHATIPVRMGNKAVDSGMISSVTAFISLYVFLFIVSAIAISATGQDVLTSISGVAATLGNIGPGLGAVGPVQNFASQHVFAKWVYTFCMLCGRLELYTVLVLFSRDTWRG